MNEQYSLPSENSVLKSKKKSKLPYIIGGSAGGLALTIFVIIMVYKSGGTTSSTDKDSSVHTQSKKPPKGKNMGGGSLVRGLTSDQDSGSSSKDESKRSSEEEENEDSGTEQGVNKNNSFKPKNRGDQTKLTNRKASESVDSLKPFKSMKTNFVSNLKKAFLSNPDDEKLKTGYANLQNQLKHVLEKTPDFVDPDEKLKVSSTLSLDDFVKTSFTTQLDEIIQEYDKKLTEACKSNVAEYEALFNAWLAWIKRLKIDLTGRTTPEWITFKSYPEAKKWCAKSNPAILSMDDIFLEELTALNITLPTDPLKITPEYILETIEKIEKKASGADPEAIKKASEKAKEVQKKYTDLIASDKSKADVFSRLLAMSQAKSKALEIITKFKVERDPLDEHSKISDDLIAKIQAAKNFDEITNIIIGEYKWDDTFITHIYDQLHSKLSMIHMEVMTKYFEARNEDPSVVDSLNRLAKNVGNDKMSSYECAEAWGNVILKMKDIGELRSYADSLDKVKHRVDMPRFNKFPYKLFEKENEDDFSRLRELHHEKTLMLLSAKSGADALVKIDALDLELSTGKELEEFFTMVRSFFWDDVFILYYAICPHDNSANGKVLLDHIKEIAKREVIRSPSGLVIKNFDVQNYFKLPKDIARCLKQESISSDELEKWAKFGTDYEMIMGSGLEKNDVNEKYFEAYRKLKNAFTKDNLALFFELLLQNPEKFEDKEKIAILVGYNCDGYSELVIISVVSTLWKINDAERIAANVMTLKNASDNQIFNFLTYNGFKFPFFLNILDDDIVRELCHKQHDIVNVELPNNFDFKHTPEFSEFVDSLKKLQAKFSEVVYSDGEFFKLSMDVAIALPKFAPSIGFLKPALKKYSPQEVTNVIKTYKKLAVVIKDAKIQTLMNAEATSVEQAFTSYRID